MTPEPRDLPVGFVEEFASDDGELPELPVGTIVIDPDCLLEELEDG